MNQDKCLLATKCKRAGDPNTCNELCFPFIRLHGESGGGGLLGVAHVPKAYRRSTVANLPFEQDNPKAFGMVCSYCNQIVKNVDNGVGLYLYGIPNLDNSKGTGNGKTTAATAILNEFLAERVILDAKKERRLEDVPGLFVNVSKFQNLYNAQFRGTREMQAEASQDYYQFKKLMTWVPLLILDDIGVRDSTEAFKGEFYEVIDNRAIEQLATIFTSNVPIEKLTDLLDDRILSRIQGSTHPVTLEGKDKRRRAF